MKFSNGIEIVEFNTLDTECIAVIGCLKTEKGMKILKELLTWVPTKFHTYIVYQEPPGKLFEYPAIKVAQDLSIIHNKSVLYIHTKGAAIDRKESPFIRNKWKELFLDNYVWCIDNLEKENTILCNFTGRNKITWYNGFFANASAWKNAKITKESDRYFYEQRIWNKPNFNVIGKDTNEAHNAIQMTALMKELIK